MDCIYKYFIKSGVHIIVGTPGRLANLVKNQKFNLGLLDLLVLDEADKLFDPAFEEELTQLFENIEVNILFSRRSYKSIFL